MRVYLPATLPGLAAARAAGGFAQDVPAGVPGHAVTAAVREWYIEGTLEELEYSVMVDAAEASLRLLAADPDAERRRVVVAVDLPDQDVHAGGVFRSSVLVRIALPLDGVASIHIDGPEAAPIVQAAIDALAAADAGDDDARFLLDEAEACDLLWYDVSELDRLP